MQRLTVLAKSRVAYSSGAPIPPWEDHIAQKYRAAVALTSTAKAFISDCHQAFIIFLLTEIGW